MFQARSLGIIIGLAVLGGACAANSSSDAESAAPQDLSADAQVWQEAYVWGYPLVVNRRTFQTLGAVIGVNRLFSQSTFTTPATRFIVAPNHDTLYSVAVLDLRSEPMVLTVPDLTDRYWGLPFIDAWGNTFHYVGTRTTAGKGGTFAITPPGWSGTLPDGVVNVPSPTPQAMVLARYFAKDDTDVPNVVSIPRTLQPLHVLTGAAAPAPPPPMGAPAGSPQAIAASGAKFFDELGDALAINPPVTDGDRTELAKLAPLGVGPGLHPAANATPDVASTLADAIKQGDQAVVAEASAEGKPKNGWNASLDVQATWTDPLLRAGTLEFLWVPHVPEEAVYATARNDASGQPLNGATSYTMHFEAHALPPSAPEGFWSVTMYGPDMFLVQNELKRYSVSDRTPNLAFNADGSLDVFVGATAPAGHESNWLPAPAGPFVMITRTYLPQATVLDGTYAYPSVTPVR